MMKKLVPFKKDINFDTNVALINSISLEHEVTKQGEHLIAGKFIISGDYKMTDTSVNLDNFEYELPFNINIDKKYDIDKASIDISDFYYEVVNNRVLNVNIELCIDDIEEVEEEVMEKEELLDELEGAEIPVLDNQELKTLPKEDRESEEIAPVERETVNVKSLFDGLDENEEYAVYKIHIVTENDTIESIINDYEVTKDLLIAYNDLSEVKVGDKIIIPANEG